LTKTKKDLPWPTIFALMKLCGMSRTADLDKVFGVPLDKWVADGKPPTKTYLDRMASTAKPDDLIILITQGHGYSNGPNEKAGDAGVMMADGPLLDGDLHDRLFTKLPAGCRALCILFSCDSGGLPMNLVWRVRVEDPKCARADVKKIPGDPTRIKADIACFASSKPDQLTFAGDLYFPLEQTVKKADVSRIGMCEFLARMQSQQRNALKHPTILDAYFSSQKVIRMRIGDFCYFSAPRDVDLGQVVEPSDEFVITGLLDPNEEVVVTAEDVAAAELSSDVEVTGLEPEGDAAPAAEEAAVPAVVAGIPVAVAAMPPAAAAAVPVAAQV
jgi:hypothetical protein